MGIIRCDVNNLEMFGSPIQRKLEKNKTTLGFFWKDYSFEKYPTLYNMPALRRRQPTDVCRTELPTLRQRRSLQSPVDP